MTTLDEIIEFAQAEGRICPVPTRWNELWEMLPDCKRVGFGWEPPLPLTLAAWHPNFQFRDSRPFFPAYQIRRRTRSPLKRGRLPPDFAAIRLALRSMIAWNASRRRAANGDPLLRAPSHAALNWSGELSIRMNRPISCIRPAVATISSSRPRVWRSLKKRLFQEMIEAEVALPRE